MKIFLSDSDNKAVHVLSVNDQCHHQLISLHEIKYLPRRLVVDKKNQKLFLGQHKSTVGVFKLTYGCGCD